MKVVAWGHVVAAALWRRLRISTAGIASLSMPKYYHYPKSAFSRWRSGHYLIPCLGPYKSTHKRHLDRFSRFFAGLTLVTLQQTDTYTDHATCVAVDSIPCCAVWCDLKGSLQHHVRLAGLYDLLTSDVSYAHFYAILLIFSLKDGWSCLQFNFFRTMLCMRGTSHGPVSVCVCVCHRKVYCWVREWIFLKSMNT